MKDGWQDRVFVAASPIHGFGVFARRPFAEGETILIREERPVTAELPLDEAKGEFEYHCDWLEGGRQVYIGYPERHVNHSCDATSCHALYGSERHIVALRAIRPGEEVTGNYSIDLWAGDSWHCRCGSVRCLGVVPGDFFSLPLDRQLELSPLLSDWFVREHFHEYQAFKARAGLA
jgi:SET domain-containing protein